MFSKNYKVIPLHLERQIPFLERSQGSGGEPPAWFLLACRAGLPSSDPLTCRVSETSGQARLTQLGVLAEGPMPAPFPACWKRAGMGEGMLLHSPRWEDVFSAFLAFPSLSWMVFPFHLPCRPSGGAGPCLHTALAMSCWGVQVNSSRELPVWIFLGDEQGQVTNSQAVTHLLLMYDFAPCSCIPARSNGNATSSASPLSLVSVTHKGTSEISDCLSSCKDCTSVWKPNIAKSFWG